MQRAEIQAPGAATLAIVRTDVPDEGAEGALAAYAQLRPSQAPPPAAGARGIEIARFYVDRPWHGQGLASMLMHAALRTASDAGADSVWLQVWSGNARALAFYRRVGFAVVGEVPFQFGSISDRDLLMARAVAPDEARDAARD